MIDEIGQTNLVSAWAKPTASLFSTPRAFSSKARRRWEWLGNGAAGRARWTTAKSAFTWATSRARNRRWSTSGCTCRRNGPRTKSVTGGRGFPKRFASRTPSTSCALEMLRQHRGVLPHRWVTGDDRNGPKLHPFREQLPDVGRAVHVGHPCRPARRSATWTRLPPPYQGSGPLPKVPFQRAENWMKTVKSWTQIEIRPGERGPLVVEAVKASVQTRLGHRNGPEETLVVFPRTARRRDVQARLLLVQRAPLIRR